MHDNGNFNPFSKYNLKENFKNFTTVGNIHTTNLKNASECSVTNGGLTLLAITALI